MTLFELPVERDPARYTEVRAHPRRVTPRARTTDPETSHAAAASIPRGAVERAIVRRFAAANGSFTDDQICAEFPMLHPPTVKSARSRLTKSGVLVACGEGVSDRGRRMQKWRLA